MNEKNCISRCIYTDYFEDGNVGHVLTKTILFVYREFENTSL